MLSKTTSALSLAATLALGVLLLITSATPLSAVTISWAPVGNAGNADTIDPASGDLYGGVAYNYSIGKYDVTVGQYTEFLNAVATTDTYGLYNTSMATDLHIAGISRSGASGSYSYSVIGSSANLPVTYVSWGDAARFANWLQNGQPTGVQGAGTTETGAYTLNGATTVADLSAVTRNSGATIVIPSESEWCKAAYYNSATDSYYQYPFSSNSAPKSALPGNTPNTGNFYDQMTGFAVTHNTLPSNTQNYLTAVGAYTSSVSPYGAFDMGGNVQQWSEALVTGAGLYRRVRGGVWSSGVLYARSDVRYFINPTTETGITGFRVAMVPEPSTAVLGALAFLGLLALARKSRTDHRGSV